MNDGSKLTSYSVLDISSTTSPDVVGTRRASPIGACIHTSDGSDSRNWLQGGSARAGTPASADALVRRDGTRYIITTPNQYSYHAGSIAQGAIDGVSQLTVNELLLGIEMECLDAQTPTYPQVDSVAEWLIQQALIYNWGYPLRVWGHYGIAAPGGRRHDPYKLDWAMLWGRVYARAHAANLV